MAFSRIFVKWWLPLLTIIIIAPFTPLIDLHLASQFYTPILHEKGHFFNNGITLFLFEYGEKLGFLVGGVLGFIFILGFFMPRLKIFRPAIATVLLTLILGAGLIINGILKETWPRPRPKQVEEFGGKLPFHPFYKPNYENWHEPQKSFPSGHTAMGFFYCSICLAAKRYRSRFFFHLGLILTLFLGIGLAMTRIVQGGHFFSDTLFSAVIMWYSALFADYLIFEKRLNWLHPTWEGESKTSRNS